MAYVPNRGDIVHLAFDPSSGREMKGDHYALVISPAAFNGKMGFALLCPISQGAAPLARNEGFLVALMGTGTATQGAVHCHELKSLDWRARQARYRETVPDYIMEEVTLRLLPLIDPDG
jgi:mRNA interferase ChpB